jgi:hypothetical protein
MLARYLERCALSHCAVASTSKLSPVRGAALRQQKPSESFPTLTCSVKRISGAKHVVSRAVQQTDQWKRYLPGRSFTSRVCTGPHPSLDRVSLPRGILLVDTRLALRPDRSLIELHASWRQQLGKPNLPFGRSACTGPVVGKGSTVGLEDVSWPNSLSLLVAHLALNPSRVLLVHICRTWFILDGWAPPR